MNHSLLARGRKKAHHLHGQLKPLKVMLQVLSLNSEAILQKKSSNRVLSGLQQLLRYSGLESKRANDRSL